MSREALISVLDKGFLHTVPFEKKGSTAKSIKLTATVLQSCQVNDILTYTLFCMFEIFQIRESQAKTSLEITHNKNSFMMNETRRLQKVFPNKSQ